MKPGDMRMRDMVNEEGMSVKEVMVAIPHAQPTVGGTFSAVVYAILVVSIVMAFNAPGMAVWYSLGNGIAAVLWFTLFKGASSAAARWCNETNIARGVLQAQEAAFESYLTDLQAKSDRTSEDETCLSKDEEVTEGETTEPK